MKNTVENYFRVTQFYETDAMGIVHHGNYILMLEEARLHWLKQLDFYEPGEFLRDINFPVLQCEVQYHRPLYFEDEVEIETKVAVDRARLIFTYKLWTKRFSNSVASGKTVHAIMDMGTRKPIRVPQVIVDGVQKVNQGTKE